MIRTPLADGRAAVDWIVRGVVLAAACVGGARAAGQGTGPTTDARAYGVIDNLPATPAFAAPSFGEPSIVHESEVLGHQPIRLAQSSEFANEATDPIVGQAPPLSPIRSGPPGRRRGIFQGFDLTSDWSPALEDPDGFGTSTFGATVKLGVPPKLVGMPLIVAPGAKLHLLDGPVGIDTPARLYDLEVGFRTFRQISERWNAMAAINVGVYGDDYSLDESDALRPNGMLIAMYQASPAVQWTFGVAVTNREDLPVIPVVGVTIDRGDIRYELTAPRPRIIWRRPSAAGEERSFYVGGELGGGAWAVRRESGETDTLNLSRYGFVLGCEAADVGGWKRRYEIGYLLGQELEYIDADEQFELDDSLILRVSLSR